MIFPYQPHRHNERVVLVIHVYIQLQKTGLFSLHKGFSIVLFFVLFTIFDSIKYRVVKIYVLWRIIKVLFLYMFSFCHSLNFYLQISYICTADRQAWLIHPQRGLFTESVGLFRKGDRRLRLLLLQWFQPSHWNRFSNGVPGCDDAIQRCMHRSHRHALHSDSLP